jgi:hypothetical protein
VFLDRTQIHFAIANAKAALGKKLTRLGYGYLLRSDKRRRGVKEKLAIAERFYVAVRTLLDAKQTPREMIGKLDIAYVRSAKSFFNLDGKDSKQLDAILKEAEKIQRIEKLKKRIRDS